MSSLARAAWRYRGFVLSSVANEFRSRLARSRFCTVWLVLHPMAQVFIYAAILSNVLAARLPGVGDKYGYAVYLMAGILCWSLFTEIISRCLTVFIDNGTLLKKIRFPRICLPLVAIGSALVNNLALLLVVAVVVPLLGFAVTWQWLWLPLLIAMTLALATGIGVCLGVLNVFARDIGQTMTVVLQFWFWATPIVYSADLVPAGVRNFLRLNPVLALVESYQNVLMFGKPPQTDLFAVALLALGGIFAALFLFRRASAEMVDVL